jgi:nucleotide-binding universal stress UspA family protein
VPHGIAVDTRLLFGEPGRAIVEACEEGIDLLVCGSRGYGPLRAVLLGGVSSYVVAHARCPVVVVPRGVTEASAEPTARVAAQTLTVHPTGVA